VRKGDPEELPRIEIAGPFIAHKKAADKRIDGQLSKRSGFAKYGEKSVEVHL